jgi:tRNA nucleotidyltransferase (CCA-adding enzyme)
VAGPTLTGPAGSALVAPGRTYRVGGAVRDALMGQTPGDIDWVVVGTTPQAMLQAGFQPVGRDFPVFLHPLTHDEYALARTERKSGPGYRGFVVQADPGVTLEEDLGRRDLTINAMAQDDQGHIIDPYGGQQDLAAGVLRHVSPAFAEDPVRLLRVARFAARWPGFVVAPETLALMQHMVDQGEVNALVPERVWQELARGLMEDHPSRMLDVLEDCAAAQRILPGLDIDRQRRQVLDHAAAQGAPLSQRAACLLFGACELGERWRVPRDTQELATALQRESATLSLAPASAEAALGLLERCDAWRRPQRMRDLILANQLLQLQPALGAPGLHWLRAHEAALRVDTQAAALDAAARGLSGPAVGHHIRQARLSALLETLPP